MAFGTSSDVISTYNAGYLVVGRLALNEHGNTTTYINGTNKDVMYELASVVVSVSLFNANAELLHYVDGVPIRFSFSVKVLCDSIIFL